MPKTRPKGTTLPDIWKSGPDEVNHRLYTDCQRARAQAKYRGEQWFITEQEYIELWRTDDRYLKKGRAPDDICLTRRDHDLPWTLDNVEFVLRLDHYRNKNYRLVGTKYKKRAKNVES